PAFKAAGASLRQVVSQSGISSVHAGRKFGFVEAGTDHGSVFADREVGAVVIATRHDSHAKLVIEAIEAGKHVFVEKPLCLKLNELAAIEAALENAQGRGTPVLLMVGFNRRFAPQIITITKLLKGLKGPKSFIMTVNAGAVEPDHWTLDRDIGG